ncbi:MAG: hypothetical protein ABIG70_02930 [Pseudomonadota bacterium]
MKYLREIELVSAPTVSAASDGFTKLFCRDMAARMMPGFVGPSGLDAVLQAGLGSNKIGWWSPPGNAVTLPGVLGITAPTAQGTVTARNVATTTMATRIRRLGYVSSPTAGSLCGHYVPVAQFTLGVNGASYSNYGGFFYQCRFVPADVALVAGARMFVGLSSSIAAATNVEPSALTNSIGVAQISTTDTMYIVYGGSVAQTPIPLGFNFHSDTASTNIFELTLFCPPGAVNWVGYRIENLWLGIVASGILTTATEGVGLPGNTTFLAHRAWRCNNTTALAVGLDISSVYIETDY